MSHKLLVALVAGLALPSLFVLADERERGERAPDQGRRGFASGRARVSAQVQEILPSRDGTRSVVFRATGRAARREALEDSPQEYVLRWTERDRPMPWVFSQGVELTVAEGELLQVRMGTVTPQYYRYGREARVELLVRDEEKRALLVVPHRINGFGAMRMRLDWVRGVGVVLTSAGGTGGAESEEGINLEGMPRAAGTTEIEETSPRGAGIVPANAPRRPVQPGRDGWRIFKGAQPEEF